MRHFGVVVGTIVGLLLVLVDPAIATKGEMQLGINQKEMTCGQPAVSRVTRSGARFTLGQVHRFEVYAKMNSAPGASDGIVRLYLDGNLVAQRTDVVWYTDSGWTARSFVGLKWFPSIGGRTDGNDPAQDFWIDDFYISVP